MSPSTRAEINRHNAQHSTGPKTEEGKHRSSLNALRHGLTSHIVVMYGEDLEAYQRHLRSFIDEYKPQGPTESQLVQSLADTAWRINRVVALENNLMIVGSTDLAVFPDPIPHALTTAAMLDDKTRAQALSSLSIHGHRLHRQFERIVKLLRELQSGRRAAEKAQPAKAAAVVQTHEEKATAAHGFVLSKSEFAGRTHPIDDGSLAPESPGGHAGVGTSTSTHGRDIAAVEGHATVR